MKSLVNHRHDPLIWCALCFIVSAVGFWWPMVASNIGPESNDSRLGMFIMFTGPFVLAAGIRAIFACRRLFIVSRSFDQNAPSLKLLLGVGVMLTVGTVLPAAWILFVFTLAFLA
jgi:cytochrome c oxidase assembly factor CtaG